MVAWGTRKIFRTGYINAYINAPPTRHASTLRRSSSQDARASATGSHPGSRRFLPPYAMRSASGLSVDSDLQIPAARVSMPPTAGGNLLSRTGDGRARRPGYGTYPRQVRGRPPTILSRTPARTSRPTNVGRRVSVDGL